MAVVYSAKRHLRVLHVYSGNMFGGVETVLVTLARHRYLNPEVESHFALCFEGRLSRELVAAGVPVHILGAVRTSRPVSVWRARRALLAVLRQGNFDVVSCHAAWAQAIFGPAVRSARLPLVFWLHDAATGVHWLERWARRTPPDLAICNSRFTAGTLRRLYPDVAAEVLYCPVAQPLVNHSHAARGETRAELDTPFDTVVIIQVSRMEPGKGHGLHLDALALLRDIPGWICWQVGGAQRPSEERYLQSLARAACDLGLAHRVRFLGQRTDVPRLLGAADIFCQPNTGPDAFGITFVEALYAGLPVVTTAIGGAKEVLTPACGILVEESDPEALAASLHSLVKDPKLRSRLGMAGPARAHELSDPATQLAKLGDFFSRVAP